MIASWWAGLDTAMKILWGITFAASLIFIVQTIMTFIGADADADFSADIDTSADGSDLSNIDGGSNLYTFRNFVNFFLGFGWTSVLLYDTVRPRILLFLIAVIVGVALVAAVMWLFKWLAGMQQSGTIDIYKSAVGCNGSVYLTVPASRSGEGKVQISINGAVREYNAMTDGDSIKNGTTIKVVEVIDNHTLLVEELNSYIV